MAFPFLALAAAAGKSYFDHELDDTYRARDERRVGAMNRSNAIFQNRLNIANTLNAPSLAVEGFKRAGLSPALAVANSMSPVSTSVPAVSSSSVNPSSFDIAGTMSAMAQIRNLDENTRAQKIANDTAEAVGENVDTSMRGFLRSVISSANYSSESKSVALDLLENQHVFSTEVFETIRNVEEFRKINPRVSADIAEDAFRRAVTELKTDNDVARAVADMPVVEWSKVQKEVLSIGMQLLKFDEEIKAQRTSNKYLDKRLFSELQASFENVKKIVADTKASAESAKLSEQSRKTLKHNDPLQYADEGDVAGETLSLVNKLFNNLTTLLPLLLKK